MSDAMKRMKLAEAVGAIVNVLVQHDEADRVAILDAVRALIGTAPAKPMSAIDYMPRPQGTAAR